MWRELKYFTKYVGVTPEFALYTATLGNAEIAGLDAITGSIETVSYTHLDVYKRQR